MAEQPKFNLPDGSGTRTSLSLVTSLREITLTGPLDSSVVDVQVKINDADFASDPALVSFDLTGFTIPNPNVFPEGYPLDQGVNTIQVRVIDVLGSVSAVSTATLELIPASDIGLSVGAPTGLRVRRRRNEVEVIWAKTDWPNVIGYNIYADTATAGGDLGYIRVNSQLITDVSFMEESLVPLSEDVTFYINEGGVLHSLLIEEDFNNNPLKIVADGIIDPGPLATDEIKVTTKLEGVQKTEYFHFVHNRQSTDATVVINNEYFSSTPDIEPIFYVITAVAMKDGKQIESAYSAELVGLPLIITTQLQDLPARTQNDIIKDYLSSVVRTNNQISAIPGSVTRDIFIEPFATEVERLHFIMSFVRRSQSFATLLQVDDLDEDGTSDPVSDNPYKLALKSALGFTRDVDVQDLVDNAFDILASNTQRTRGGSEFSVGQVMFYTTKEPTADITVVEGTTVSSDSGVAFVTTSRVVLPYASRSSYYNLKKRRWEIQANIRAVTAGSAGDVAASTIIRVIGGGPMMVENLEATRFGQDQESNASLAERCILAYTSVDSGTEGGYLSTALRQKNVFRAKVVKAGDDYMMRDWDEVRLKHIGGKVDVWVQGSEEVQTTDTFALQFQVSTGIQFVLDSSPAQMIFITNDARITPETPITEMLGATAAQILQGYAFRNLTTGTTFDLTGYTILAYNRIQLNTAVVQPAVGVNDVVVGDFRYQEDTRYIFSKQPVFGVSTVSSINSGEILEEGVHYTLVRTADPLLEGSSSIAGDYITLTQSGGIPTGDLYNVNDERHVMIGEEPESLTNLGANPTTVRVFTLDRVTEYDGPSAVSPDFLIIPGSAITPLQVIRVPGAGITNGEEVSIDYGHDENFEAVYTINNLLQRVQSAIDINRHTTADVQVKLAIPNGVALEMTIVLKPNVSQSQVDAALKTKLSQLLNGKSVGESVYQSDVVQAVENTKGVAYVVLPMARMTMADGALIVREPLNSSSTFIAQQGGVKVYALKDALMYPTTAGGGAPQDPRGVFENTQPLALVSTYSTLLAGSQRALIVGDEGLFITGYSDDVTLTAQGHNTDAERIAQRRALTSNRVFVSKGELEYTETHSYHATYTVQGDTGSRSIIVGSVAYVELEELTMTFRSPENE